MNTGRDVTTFSVMHHIIIGSRNALHGDLGIRGPHIQDFLGQAGTNWNGAGPCNAITVVFLGKALAVSL